jgi:uncharacterized protein YdiU (UPF0061 family)
MQHLHIHHVLHLILETADQFSAHYHQMMARKIGFDTADDGALALLEALLAQMQDSRTDYTLLFRALGEVTHDDDQPITRLRDRFIDRARFDRWLVDYRARLRTHAKPDPERRAAMQAVNPKYVLRNYLAQIAIEQAERGDDAEIDRLLAVLRNPFDDHPHAAHYAAPPPDWADNIHVSCSS